MKKTSKIERKKEELNYSSFKLFDGFSYLKIKYTLKIAVIITEIRLATNESNLNPSGACRIYAIAITKHTIAGTNVMIKCFLFSIR